MPHINKAFHEQQSNSLIAVLLDSVLYVMMGHENLSVLFSSFTFTSTYCRWIGCEAK